MNNISLFNVNAIIGQGAYEKPQFPDINSLIAHMDYLGIDRSLVSHIEARDLNPTWGNSRLLKEISESKYAQRLIPVFAISPSCYYETGALKFIKKSLRTNKVRAFCIHPEVARFPIYQLERILMELADWKPVLLWNCRNATINDFKEICYLAEIFPQISFIMTQRMWPGFGGIIDAMWRQKNIYTDTSLIHMRNTVKILVDEFGANRVIFGIGDKSHYGASIAALVHYEITNQQRELIAHRNIERLLGLKAINKKLYSAPEILSQKPLWQTIRSGKPIKEINIIDAHAHVGPTHRGWYVRDIKLPDYINGMLHQMNKLGVKYMVVSGETALFGNPVEGNIIVERNLINKKNRFLGYLVYNPLYGREMNSKLDSFFKSGFFIGFKILPIYWQISVTDKGFTPVWEYANKYNLPVLSHTWDDLCDSPALFKNIVRKYKNVNFILGHSGGGTKGRIEAEELTVKNSNVFMEFCGSFCTPRPFEESISRVGISKIIFGSDGGAHDQAWELGRYLSMPLPDQKLIPGLGTNFISILKKSKLLSQKFNI